MNTVTLWLTQETCDLAASPWQGRQRFGLGPAFISCSSRLGVCGEGGSDPKMTRKDCTGEEGLARRKEKRGLARKAGVRTVSLAGRVF